MFFYVFRDDNGEWFCALCDLLRTLHEWFSFHRFEGFLCFGNRILSYVVVVVVIVGVGYTIGSRFVCGNR